MKTWMFIVVTLSIIGLFFLNRLDTPKSSVAGPIRASSELRDPALGSTKHPKSRVSGENSRVLVNVDSGGLEIIGSNITLPDELVSGTGFSGTGSAIASQAMAQMFSRLGRHDAQKVFQVTDYPSVLKNEKGGPTFGPVYCIRGDTNAAVQIEDQLKSQFTALIDERSVAKIWNGLKIAADKDPNLRGFGKYDLYIRFTEQDHSNQVTTFKYALCEPIGNKVVFYREMQTPGMGPYLSEVFSYKEIDEK